MKGAALTVASGGELSLLRVEMGSGSVSFSGAVTVTDCALTGTDLVGSTASAALSLSGGTLTGSSVSLSGGSATLGGSCVAVDSPLSIADGTLSVSGCELRSDGSSVPLTVGSGGSATVTGTVFRSSGGDITAVSVSDGGSLTVGSSELIGADGSADPFPCDGTLPDEWQPIMGSWALRLCPTCGYPFVGSMARAHARGTVLDPAYI